MDPTFIRSRLLKMWNRDPPSTVMARKVPYSYFEVYPYPSPVPSISELEKHWPSLP